MQHDQNTTTAKRGEHLAPIAADINREHRAAQEHATAAIQHARRAGELLLEAKAALQHGDWSAWIDQHFDGSERTAQRYMRLSRHWHELEAKAPRVADLTLNAAEALLAEPKPASDVGERDAWPTEGDARTFSETLASLREIRDRKLYRETHTTFEDYCRERWNIPEELLDLVDLELGHPSEEQRSSPAILDDLTPEGSLVCGFETHEANVTGVIIPVSEPFGTYFAAYRMVAYRDVGEHDPDSFVEGDKRGVHRGHLAEHLSSLGLPPLDSGEWTLRPSSDFGNDLREMVQDARSNRVSYRNAVA